MRNKTHRQSFLNVSLALLVQATLFSSLSNAQYAPPSGGYGQAPAYGKQPAYGGQPQAPAYGGAPAQPAYGGAQAPAYGGQPQAPAYGGQPQAPAYGGGAPAQPAYGGQPAGGFGQAAPRAAAAPAGTAGQVPLDRTLKPQEGDEISTVFENVIAVQRKAKVKAKRQIFSPYLSFDFSDAPYTMYGAAINYGYAFSEFWEVYLNVIPTFITNERTISKKVKELKFPNTSYHAEISSEKAQLFTGLEINYVPIYGKDSWGPYGIIRSDTFINFGAGLIKYETLSGMRVKFALGKTWFLTNLFNLRAQAGGSVLEGVINGKKEMQVIGLLESGLVFYF